MALKRPTPKKLTQAAQDAILKASMNQTGEQVRVKSYDPENYPVFDVPICKKLLVYVPNHTISLPDGGVDLRKDKFAAHAVIDGRSYADIRCSAGVVEDSLHLDGTCPLCDGVNVCWDLYKYKYTDLLASRGLSAGSPEEKDLLKDDRKDLVKAMVIKKAEVWCTFPIVVIDCEEKDGVLTTVPKLDENGRINGKAMWYSIRENTFKDKWESAYDGVESSDGSVVTHPGGLWAILNFCYTPKSGSPDKMGSARALKVTYKNMGNKYDEWAKYFDKLTEGWTPAKAQETVILDVIRNMDELNEAADTLLADTKRQIQMYQLAQESGVSAGQAQTSMDAVLQKFGGTQVSDVESQESPVLLGEMPDVGVQ